MKAAVVIITGQKLQVTIRFITVVVAPPKQVKWLGVKKEIEELGQMPLYKVPHKAEKNSKNWKHCNKVYDLTSRPVHNKTSLIFVKYSFFTVAKV